MAFDQQEQLKTLFLLGAGSSVPAGIPTIEKMTRDFVNDPIMLKSDSLIHSQYIHEENSKLTKIFQALSDVAENRYGSGDLEFMMTILHQIEDKDSREFFETKYPSLKTLFDKTKNDDEKREKIQSYIAIAQNYIRNVCEDISQINYLWTLDGLVANDSMQIFTLNYDGLIENSCEKRKITYTDGFDSKWNPKMFENNSKINLFKLHGSIYWLRSKSGNIIKVPIKGLDTSTVRYLDGEEVSELMLYPQLQKDRQLEVFSWLERKFKDLLNEFEFCVVIGYSFRDKEIKNSILDSLTSNPKLWLVIVSPHASANKAKVFSNNKLLFSKIVTMDEGVEEALRNRKLHTLLQILSANRQMEERTYHFQKSNESRDDQSWTHILTNYLRINHHDKVKELVEWLSTEKFIRTNANFPQCVEGVVLPFVFQYMIDYHKNNKFDKLNIWKKIFYEGCISLEYEFFTNSNLPKLFDFNPVKQNEVPTYCMEGGTEVRTMIVEFKRELTNSISSVPDNLKPQVMKLVETLDFLYTKGPHSIINQKPLEIIEGYQQNNIGIKKWVKEINDLLK